MKFTSIVKKVAKIGTTQGLPIASAFGVPGASLVQDAIIAIQKDTARPNDDAVQLTGAAIDELDKQFHDFDLRLKVLEQRAGIPQKS